MQNQVIEIHDSALDRITLEGGTAVLYFPKVYIHSSEGRPAIDAGTCWTQEAVIRIGNARIEGKFSQESREANGDGAHYLSDGSLAINGTISDPLNTAIIAVTLRNLLAGATANTAILTSPTPVVTPTP